jgi:hypothetical protein
MKIFVIGGVTQSTGRDPQAENPGEQQILQTSMRAVGRSLARAGHDILVCSPFDGSSDVNVVLGAAEVASQGTRTRIEYYYPNSKGVVANLDRLEKSLKNLTFVRFPQQPPADENSPEAWQHAWLLSQLSAMEPSNLVIAVGGKLTGPMSLLLPLAESRRKDILPLRFLGGAAEKCFERKQYELHDRLGDRISLISVPGGVEEVAQLVETFGRRQSRKLDVGKTPTIFLSYAKARPEMADFVEMVLRRRNLPVLRDDKDFAPGSPLPSEIRDYIHKAEVFIAIWCNEYACSPWCFDELDLALDRSRAGAQTTLLLNIDGTRIVPPKARGIVTYPASTRQEIEGQVIKFLDAWLDKPGPNGT